MHNNNAQMTKRTFLLMNSTQCYIFNLLAAGLVDTISALKSPYCEI